MNIISKYEIAGGSVTGTMHLQPLRWRNNQDAYRWRAGADCLVAGVADGCSDGQYSEVGAHVGLGLMLKAAQRGYVKCFGALHSASFEQYIQNDLDYRLHLFAESMDLNKYGLFDYLLFSIIGVVLSERTGCVFHCGDGYYFINGDKTQLGPYPDNKPQYFAYNLIWPDVWMRFAYFDVSKLESLLIATDGLVHVPDPSIFWTDDRFFRNKDQVRRQLALYNRKDGILKDDTTLIVIRRKHGDTGK